MNFELADTLRRLNPLRRDEVIRFLTAAAALRPSSPGIHFSLGAELAASGFPEDAIAEYREAIRLKADYPSALVNLGHLLSLTGRAEAAKEIYQRAEAAYRKSIKLDPKNVGAHLDLAGALAARGKRDEAIAEYRKGTELDQTNDFAHYKLGAALKESGDLDGGLAEFRRAWTLNPSNWGARAGLFQIYDRRGQLKEIQELRATWQKLLEHNPPERDAWLGYAELCLFLGREEEYRRHRADLLARFGDTADPVIAECVSRACLLLPASGDELKRAAALIDRAVAAGPEHRSYGFFLAAKGLAEYRLGRFDSAIGSLQQAHARRSTMPVTHLVLAMARQRSGQTRQAREILAAALQSYIWGETTVLERDKWIAHVLRREAVALIVPELFADHAKEIDPDPKDATVHNILAWLLATHANPKLRDPGRAVNCAKRAVELAPKEGNYWNTLGVAHYRAGDWKSALAALEKSMELRKGGDSIDWFFLAMCHEKLGDKEKARQWYDRATRWMDKNQANNEELRRFRAEAAQVLGLDKKIN